MAGNVLGPTRPDKLTIWPLEEGFGIDVRWSGGGGGEDVARLIDQFVW